MDGVVVEPEVQEEEVAVPAEMPAEETEEAAAPAAEEEAAA